MSTARLSICPCTDGRAASAALMAWTSGAQWSFAAITASCAGSWWASRLSGGERQPGLRNIGEQAAEANRQQQ